MFRPNQKNPWAFDKLLRAWHGSLSHQEASRSPGAPGFAKFEHLSITTLKNAEGLHCIVHGRDKRRLNFNCLDTEMAEGSKPLRRNSLLKSEFIAAELA